MKLLLLLFSGVVALAQAPIPSIFVTPGSGGSGSSICTLAGSQTTGYVLTATDNSTGCDWEAPSTGSSVSAVSFSATPTFSGASGAVRTFTMTLTGNVTSCTLSGLTAGQVITFVFTQDGTGGRTVACAGLTGLGTVSGVASKIDEQTFYATSSSAATAITSMWCRTCDPAVIIPGSTSGAVTLKAPAVAGTNTVTFPAGTTDFTATGGTSRVVKQVTTGAALTVAQLACADLSDAGAGCTGSGGSTDIFAVTYPNQWYERFCSVFTGTGGYVGTYGWNASAGGTWNVNNGPGYAICGVRLTTGTSSGDPVTLALRAQSGGVGADSQMMPRATLIAKTTHFQWWFRLSATVTTTSYFVGLSNDENPHSASADRRFFGVRFLSGTDTNWSFAYSNGSWNVPGGGCTASVAPVASNYYVVDISNSATSTFTVKLYTSATDYDTALGTSDLFSSCTATLQTNADGYGPAFEVQTATTAARVIDVHRWIGQVSR